MNSPSFTNRPAAAILVFGLVHYGLCAHNITCIGGIYGYLPEPRHPCSVYSLTDSDQDIVFLRNNYTHPDEITEMHFGIYRFRGTLNLVEQIPGHIFTALPNIQIFTMTTNLTELRPQDFDGAINLTELRLSDNNIKKIRANVFSASSLPKLFDLHLQRNEISEIEDNSFYGLNKLRILELAENRLNVIHRLTFAGLEKLWNLDLSKNVIETIENGAFDLPELDLLRMLGNKLKLLSDNTFQQSPVLRWLDLSDNQLEHIGQSLYRVRKAETIRLSKNHIQDVDLVIFAKMPKLKELTLSENGLTFATTNVDEEEVVGSKSRLYLIEIEGNNFTDANELLKLRIFPRIRRLALGRNLFSDLEIAGYETLKDMLPSLRILYLRDLQNIDCDKIALIARKLKSKGVKVEHDCSVYGCKYSRD